MAEPYKPSVNQRPPVGTMVKIPFNPLKLFLIITNILASTKSGSLSSNLAFFGHNMDSKRSHSIWVLVHLGTTREKNVINI